MLRELREGVDDFVRVDLADVMASDDDEEPKEDEEAHLQPAARYSYHHACLGLDGFHATSCFIATVEQKPSDWQRRSTRRW